MANKKKKLDKLSLDMIECEKAGYGVHYGAWKATQTNPVIIEKRIPEGWLVCQWCGKPFKPKTKRPQKYCEAICQKQASYQRSRQQNTNT